MPGSSGGAEQTAQAPGTEPKLLSAEAETSMEQPSHEGLSHGNGSTSAEQAPRLTDPVPQADASDTELQRRKAALLQRVEDALARAEAAAPAPATGTMETPVDMEVRPNSHDNESAEPPQAMQTATMPPRKVKLQPGDYYITLPKPPSAVPSISRGEPGSQLDEHAAPEENSARPEAEISGEQHHATGLSSPELAAATNLGQAADATRSGERQGPDDLLQDRRESSLNSTETQPDSSAALGAEQTSVTGAAGVPGSACLSELGGGADAWQHSTTSNGSSMLQPFPESNSSPGRRYGAAAARKEEAQELALEQAILEVHWKHAEDGLGSDEAEAEEPAEGALVAEHAATYIPEHPQPLEQTWQQTGATAAYPGYHGSGVWDGSQIGSPWSDWAAVEGSAPPWVAGNSSMSRDTATKAAGAVGAASGQWSPAELAAQAKAWADWAAWQAQSGAQSSQISSDTHPSAALVHPGTAVGQPATADVASSAAAQPSSAELEAQAKAWADWAGGQHAAQAQHHSDAPPAAGSQQRAAQAGQSAQAGEEEMVSVPASLYKRYQELEWAEWHRQYERWQVQYNSWYACYEHWYSSYLAWYNAHGGAT